MEELLLPRAVDQREPLLQLELPGEELLEGAPGARHSAGHGRRSVKRPAKNSGSRVSAPRPARPSRARTPSSPRSVYSSRSDMGAASLCGMGIHPVTSPTVVLRGHPPASGIRAHPGGSAPEGLRSRGGGEQGALGGDRQVPCARSRRALARLLLTCTLAIFSLMNSVA